MGQGLRVHATAVVAHREPDVVPRDDVRMVGGISHVQRGVCRLQGNLAHTGDGVAGINAQVGQDLIELAVLERLADVRR